jgi:hypothetical protein
MNVLLNFNNIFKWGSLMNIKWDNPFWYPNHALTHLERFWFFWRLYFWMVNYLSFHNFSFALTYFLMQMAKPQCDTPIVLFWLPSDTILSPKRTLFVSHVCNANCTTDCKFSPKWSFDCMKSTITQVCLWHVVQEMMQS